MKILLIEDEKKVASFIKQGLTEESYVVDSAPDGIIGERLASENEYDAIILDIMLPKKSGFAVCKSIRSFNEKVPILMLTALDSTDDKIEGFEKGADDYLIKPFEFRELLVRLKALLRRGSHSHSGTILELADLKIDTYNKTVSRSGNPIKLTAREYSLLLYLMINKRRVVTKTDIAENVWDTSFSTDSNSIEVYINFLRRKIDKNFVPKLIHTVVGMGYVLKMSNE